MFSVVTTSLLAQMFSLPPDAHVHISSTHHQSTLRDEEVGGVGYKISPNFLEVATLVLFLPFRNIICT